MTDPKYKMESDAPKLSHNGYEMFIQAPVFLDLQQNVLTGNNFPDWLKYPINETFFFRDFTGGHGRFQIIFF